MSQRFRDDNPVNTTHLFPSAIVCSCGDRFDSDWSTNSNHAGSALWLYLSHKAKAITSSPQTLIKPHRVICTLVSCVLCAKSVGVNHYRAHLALCRRGDDTDRLAILTYRRLTNRSSVSTPCFECVFCLDDGLFHRLDVDTMLVHRHGRAESHSPLGGMELYVTCRVCASGVSVDNALEHAAFSHREHLSTTDAVAEMFFTAPKMRPLPRGLGEGHPISNDGLSLNDQNETPVFAPDCRQSLDRQHRLPPPSNGDVRNVKHESSADSLADNTSHSAFDFRGIHYLAEEPFSKQSVESLCQMDAEPTTAEPCLQNLTEEKSSAPSPIVTGNRCDLALQSPGRPIVTIVARSRTVGRNVQECDECGQTFAKRLSLTIHQHQHTGELLENVVKHECDDCGLNCSTAQRLELHRKAHAVESQKARRRVFECDECGRVFSQDNMLTLHQRTHMAKRPFACSDCGKRFLRSCDVKKHRRTHTGEQPFVCTDCGKRFRLSGNLIVHRRIHTGERPYACADCDKRFPSSNDLTMHRRVHTGERPFACTDCNKRFAKSTSLTVHRRVHTGERPFACSDCAKRFVQSGGLIQHRRLHTGERPFGCSECDKRFINSSNLDMHRRVHTGERPFGCSDCDKRFTQRRDLKKHRLVHRS